MQWRWDAQEASRARDRMQAEGRAHTRDCRCPLCWAIWSPIRADLRGGGVRHNRPGAAASSSGHAQGAGSSEEHGRAVRQRLQLADATADDLPGEQQVDDGAALDDGQEHGGDGGGEPEGGDKRSRKGKSKYVAKADWLSHSRWRSEVKPTTEKLIYFKTNDDEWDLRFIIGPSRLGRDAGNGVRSPRL